MFSRVFNITLIFCLQFFFYYEQVSSLVPPSESKLIFYFGPSSADSIAYNLSDATDVLKHPKFIFNETHCYLHGYLETQDSETVHEVVDSYLKRNNINLLTIDWAKAAGGNYISAVENTQVLGEALADMTLNLFAAGLERKSFTMVGHSLGAQVAGKTGREIMKKTNGAVKIYKMAALDAAFPLFFPPLLQTVNKNDAEFLQAIHTDIGLNGQPISLGHVDFWPNGGHRVEPGCPKGFFIPLSSKDLCSHQRSCRFWAESVANINNGPEFWAYPASSYIQYLLETSANLKKKPIQMGLNCPMEARGDYYLTTNSQPPFAKGLNN